VKFVGDVPTVRLDRAASPDIAELLTRLTDPAPQVIADPDAGWNRLRDRIIRDLSEQGVILPQQLKIMLRGIQSLKWLNIAQYESAGGATAIEAFYIEQQISGTARKVGLDASQVRAMLVALIDPLNPTKTWSLGKEDLLAATLKGNGKRVAGDKLDKALEELERGEMVRSPSDPESGRTVYRLDHDYLIRGVSAAERRANRWHYLLEDRFNAFQNAGTLRKKWKALLPVGTQCRLAWERMRGRFLYGNRRGYVLMSLARFPTRIVGALISFFIVLIIVSIPTGVFLQRMWRRTASFPQEIQSITDPDEVRTKTQDFLTNIPMLRLQEPKAMQILAGQLIERLQHTTNTDQQSALLLAAADVISALKPTEVQTLASSLIPRILSTTEAAQLSALTRGFATILTQLNPEATRALAEPIRDAIRSGVNSDQRRALGLALAAVASELKPEEAGALDTSIVEAIQGRQTVPLSPAADERRPTPKAGMPAK
jgi:hypothetical protein